MNDLDDSTQLVTELHRTLRAVSDVLGQHIETGPCTQLAGHHDAAAVARAVLTILLQATTDLYYRARDNSFIPGWDQAFALLDHAIEQARAWRDGLNDDAPEPD